MTENKTRPTDASVGGFIGRVEGEERRADCEALVALMQRVTGEPAVLWGDALIGFGTYHYRYASGHQGDAPLAGFSPRKGDTSVYLSCDAAASAALLAKLGRHRIGKSCLYLRRLADVDMAVLEQLVVASMEDMRQRYPQGGD